MFARLLEQLTAIQTASTATNRRLDALEQVLATREDNGAGLPQPGQADSTTILGQGQTGLPEANPGTFEGPMDGNGGRYLQHGIRAQTLWTSNEFVLNREPLKHAFKLEDPKDYFVWSYSMLTLLENEGLSPFVLGTVGVPPDPTNENELWLQNRYHDFNAAAEAAILRNVGKAQIALLTRSKGAHNMWQRLKDSYMMASEVNVARLESELMAVKWKRNTKLDAFIQQVDRIGDQLRSCGQEVPDSKLRMALLKGLPDRLENIKHILLDKGETSYVKMCDSLRAHVGLSMSTEVNLSEKSSNSALMAGEEPKKKYVPSARKRDTWRVTASRKRKTTTVSSVTNLDTWQESALKVMRSLGKMNLKRKQQT